MSLHPSPPVLFNTNGFHAIEIEAVDIQKLQRFFELNPEYFFSVTGLLARPKEAHEEFHETLPEGWPFTKKWVLGFVNESESLVGMATVISDLLAPGVWHINLFVVATSLHGSGAAQALYMGLEHWAHEQGARWLRLGIVQGNARAERFWEKSGFVEVRKRCGVEMGWLINTLRVMVKPLFTYPLAEYLSLVARDRPESD